MTIPPLFFAGVAVGILIVIALDRFEDRRWPFDLLLGPLDLSAPDPTAAPLDPNDAKLLEDFDRELVRQAMLEGSVAGAEFATRETMNACTKLIMDYRTAFWHASRADSTPNLAKMTCVAADAAFASILDSIEGRRVTVHKDEDRNRVNVSIVFHPVGLRFDHGDEGCNDEGADD